MGSSELNGNGASLGEGATEDVTNKERRDKIRNEIREIVSLCYDYLDAAPFAREVEKDRLCEHVRLRSDLNLEPWVNCFKKPRPEIFLGVVARIDYLVATAETPEEVKLVGDIVSQIVDAIFDESKLNDSKYGRYSPQFGYLNFTTVTMLKQTYWEARQRKILNSKIPSRRRPGSTDKLIRVNDVPFAEAVHPELIARYAPHLGYTIDVVRGIDPSEIGTALYTNRIDVAFYNGSIKKQFRGLSKRFEERLIFHTGILFHYQDYPILQNPTVTAANTSAFKKIGVPGRSDFEDVIASHRGRKSRFFNLPLKSLLSQKSRNLVIEESDIVYLSSADEALERLTNGELQYCITGGLQGEYASKKFGSRAHLLGYLNGAKSHTERDDNGARFWAAVQSRHQAEALLYPMIEIWNEHVVGRWAGIVSGLGSEMRNFREDLVTLVNAGDHRAFVDDFDMLNELITRHEHKRDSIEVSIDCYDPWKPEELHRKNRKRKSQKIRAEKSRKR